MARDSSKARRAPRRTQPGFVTTVHARGRASLDGMLALTEIASREAPQEEILGELCARIASLLGVEVCSIYLLAGPGETEAGDRRSGELVLRATYGFPQEAVGTVRMRVGEGLTGFAVECLRPVSVAMVTSDARNKSFDALGEERFPALCALPLVDGGRAVGALVVQRRQPRAFGPREVVLVAATAPPVLLAIDRARARRRAQIATTEHAQATGRPQEVTLRGVSGSPGRALGTVAVRRGWVADHRAAASGSVSDERARLGKAFADASTEVAELHAWACERVSGAAAGKLGELRFLLDDARLRGRAFRHVESGASAASAVERMAREYARVLSGAAEETLRGRALELEALCARLHTRLAGDEPALAPGRILIAARLTVFEAVELAVSHGAGAALAAPVAASPGVDVAHALGLPVVCDVRALFQWAADGDRALLDAEAGVVVLNPSRTDVAAHRRRSGSSPGVGDG
ncbi:MAG: GAF domain-containing protein [Myxococcales bacterium]|nr:GAF domain-containing protein [Myxococcales bacterium]